MLTGNKPAGAAPPEQTALMGSSPGAAPKFAAAYVYPWSFMWFGAAFCVMVGSMISFLDLVFSLEWVDALEMAYLFFFGVLLAIVDTPLFTQVMVVTSIRQTCNRFVAILTRVTGKGIVYMFLGCTLWSSMFSNLEGGFLLFLAFFLGGVIFLVGLVSIGLGVMKSRTLNTLRQEFKKDGNQLQQMYTTHARLNPQTGLTPEEFNRMAPYARGVQFEGTDLKFIFGALSTAPARDFISLQDLFDWVNGPFVLI